jgi:aspartate/methionine/tyrosine aminotransferase
MQQVATSYISRPDALAFAREIRTETSSRVALVDKILGDVDGLTYIRPRATFFVFLNMSCTGLDSRAFAYELLRGRHVCVCPGDSFGQQGQGHVRVTLTGDRHELEEGMRRLADFVQARS